MNSLLHKITCIGLSVVSLTVCSKESAPKVMTREETTALLFNIDVHDIELPEETLEQRASKIQEIVAPYGLVVAISDTVEGETKVDWLKIPRGNLAILMKFTCGRQKLFWRPIAGGVEFYYEDYREDPVNDSAAAQEGIEPFANPGESPPSSRITGRAADDGDPFKPLKKANKP